MIKSCVFSAFVAYLIACGLVICPTFAQDPPPANADSVCNDLLLDQALAQNRKTFDPQDLSIFQSDITPIMNLADQIPDFGKALRGALNKKWSFDPDNSFADCQTENSHFVAVAGGTKVACQYPHAGTHANEIVIDPNWYETLNSKTCQKPKTSDDVLKLKEKQRGLIVHELLLGITMGTSITQSATNQVFAALTRQPLPSASELQSIIESSGFGIYGLKSTRADSCHSVQDSMPQTAPAIGATLAAVGTLAASCAMEEANLITSIQTLSNGCGISMSFGQSTFDTECMRNNINKTLGFSQSTLGAASDVSQYLSTLAQGPTNLFDEPSALQSGLAQTSEYSVNAVQKKITTLLKMMKTHQDAGGDCL
jgi:hypothetical protein